MERLSVAQKSPKRSKSKKKLPIKVVYISNPMRVQTSESEFRSVVQELTGRDSDVADSMAKYPMAETVEIEKPEGEGRRELAHHAAQVQKEVGCHFDMFDEAFAVPVLENHPGLMPPLQFYDYIRMEL